MSKNFSPKLTVAVRVVVLLAVVCFAVLRVSSAQRPNNDNERLLQLLNGGQQPSVEEILTLPEPGSEMFPKPLDQSTKGLVGSSRARIPLPLQTRPPKMANEPSLEEKREVNGGRMKTESGMLAPPALDLPELILPAPHSNATTSQNGSPESPLAKPQLRRLQPQLPKTEIPIPDLIPSSQEASSKKAASKKVVPEEKPSVNGLQTTGVMGAATEQSVQEAQVQEPDFDVETQAAEPELSLPEPSIPQETEAKLPESNPVAPKVSEPATGKEAGALELKKPAPPIVPERTLPEPEPPVVTQDETENEGSDDDEMLIVLHAGGAVRLEVPESWRIREVPHGRQLRLLMQLPRDADDVSNDGEDKTEEAGEGPGAEAKDSDADVDYQQQLWLSLRYRPDGRDQLVQAELQRLASTQLTKYTRNRAENVRGGNWETQVGNWARFDFELLNKPNRNGEKELGFYMVRQVDWGRLEVYGSRKLESEEETQNALDDLLKMALDIELVKPKGRKRKPKANVQAARPVLGLWKSSRSLMLLGENGKITVISDKPFEVEEDDTNATGKNKDKEPKTETTITGRFRARQDLIFTQWDDGSKLNYRWKLYRGDLLLTDSLGRTSKLYRIPNGD